MGSKQTKPNGTRKVKQKTTAQYKNMYEKLKRKVKTMQNRLNKTKKNGRGPYPLTPKVKIQNIYTKKSRVY